MDFSLKNKHIYDNGLDEWILEFFHRKNALTTYIFMIKKCSGNINVCTSLPE